MSTEQLQRVLRTVAATALLGFPLASWGNLADAETAYGKQEYFAAFREYVPLAKDGDAVAQAALGRIYLDGQGAPQDVRAAASWYEKAAAQGHAGAQFQLAKMYAAGVGVKADMTRAAQLMEKSANQGVVWAMYSLGVMYRDGHGVGRDLVQGIKWLDLAASSSESAAAEYIALAKVERTAMEPALNPEQRGVAQKLAGEWLAAKRSRDHQWQKPINRPAALPATGEAADGKAERTPAASQKADEPSPLARDYYPKS